MVALADSTRRGKLHQRKRERERERQEQSQGRESRTEKETKTRPRQRGREAEKQRDGEAERQRGREGGPVHQTQTTTSLQYRPTKRAFYAVIHGPPHLRVARDLLDVLDPVDVRHNLRCVSIRVGSVPPTIIDGQTRGVTTGQTFTRQVNNRHQMVGALRHQHQQHHHHHQQQQQQQQEQQEQPHSRHSRNHDKPGPSTASTNSTRHPAHQE